MSVTGASKGIGRAAPAGYRDPFEQRLFEVKNEDVVHQYIPVTAPGQQKRGEMGRHVSEDGGRRSQKAVAAGRD